MSRCIWTMLVLGCLGPSIGAAFGQGAPPVGQEFQVNSYTPSNQRIPAVAVDSQGGFVVVWDGNGSSGSDDSNYSIHGQRYAPDGTAIGSEFQVNSYTTDTQYGPSVSVGPGGEFVVAWTSLGSGGSDSDANSIQAQRYSSDGTALGAEFQVNTATAGSQFCTLARSVSVGPGGEFVVVWSSPFSGGSDSSSFSVQGQRYSSDGTALGGEFQINTTTAGTQVRPSVSVGPSGEFVVAWYSFVSGGSDNDSASIQGQRYSSSGTTLGAEFQVNTTITGDQVYPTVSVGPDGEFVVVWESAASSGTDSEGTSIQAQRYSSAGTALGAEFQVNTTTASGQRLPSVSVGARGEFVASWQSYASAGSDDSLSSIQAQRYSSDGTALGAEFQVNTSTLLFQFLPSVSVGSGGEIVIAWYSSVSGGSDNDGTSIQAQRYAPAVDLVLSKFDLPDPVDAGGILVYTLLVTNTASVNPARGVMLSDPLPSELHVLSVSSTAGSCGVQGGPPGGTLSCDLGDLGAGQSATVLLLATVDAAVAAALENTASVSSMSPELNTEDNSATAETSVNTPTPTATPTATPTNTPTNTPTATPTATPTNTPTATPTFTPTFTPTATPTNTPTATPTNTPTFTPTATATPTSSATSTPTATPSITPTATVTATPGFPDADGDGVPDLADQCPDTPPDSFVDSRGCPGDKMRVEQHVWLFLLLLGTLGALFRLRRRRSA